jgi:hypothetical protein
MSETDPPPPDHQAVSAPSKVEVVTTGICEGFTLQVKILCDPRRLQESLRYLKTKGIEPPPKPLAWEYTADGAPICPRHGVPMRKREKQGDEWHSHKCFDAMGREVYCRGYPGPDSPGYRGTVDPPQASEAEPELEPLPRRPQPPRERADYSTVPASRGTSRWGAPR